MDAEALLLNDGVRCAVVELEAGRESDGAERAVRRDGDVEAFRHSGDFADFRDTASVAEVWLDDIGYPFDYHVFEAPAGEVSLASGDGCRRVAAKLRKRFDVFDENRLFDEHKMIWLKLFHENAGHRLMDAAMEIDGDAEIRPECVTDGGDAIDGGSDFAPVVDVVEFGGAVHFDGLIALLRLFDSRRGSIGGAVATDPAIDLNLFADGAAEQVVNR